MISPHSTLKPGQPEKAAVHAATESIIPIGLFCIVANDMLDERPATFHDRVRFRFLLQVGVGLCAHRLDDEATQRRLSGCMNLQLEVCPATGNLSRFHLDTAVEKRFAQGNGD